MQRQRSQRLVTTTPDTSVGAALESIKSRLSPKLFDGLEIKKVSSNGSVKPRILTLSEDLFTVFISHHKFGKSESLSDRIQYKSFKAYAKIVNSVTGTTVQAKHDIRVIDVADILFVQSGFVGSRKLEACKEELDTDKVISVFHNNCNTMDFLVESNDDLQSVLDAIKTIREVYHASKMKLKREERLLRYVWYDTDFNKTGNIDQAEFLQLLNRINIYLKQEHAIRFYKCFMAAKLPKKGGRIGRSKEDQKGITFEECLYLLEKISLDLNNGTEISDAIFDELFGTGKHIVTAEEFLNKFLHQKQNENTATIDDVKELFLELNSLETTRVDAIRKGDENAINRATWREYLMSSRNDLYDPQAQKYDPSSLDRPLTEYWINSSHNTYLTGDQLKSLSSVEMYAVAMHRGCKCLELDCWGEDGDSFPYVYHGYTITSKIPFHDIITCVKHYVDDNPDTLPIILSLENHCSHEQQRKMAEILKNTLEDRLYKLPESSGPLPSPLDLVGKVVLKGKRPSENDDDELTQSESMEDSEAFEDELVEAISSEVEGSLVIGTKIKSSLSKESDSPPPPKIVPELACLTFFNGVKFKDFSTSLELPLADMHSFSGSKLEKLYRDPANVERWKEYNVNHMSRIYPSGSSLDSSNYNPVVPWSSGCQMVALNFQTDDSPMTLNDGRFRANGGCGYVHKPPSVFPPGKELKPRGKMTLRIKVLSGSCLPKPYGESVGEVMDPYVIVREHDVENRDSMRRSRGKQIKQTDSSDSGHDDMPETVECKTKHVSDNGFCPQWNDSEYFTFSVNSDVAMISFAVMDRSRGFIDELMCKTAIPVSCLRQGFRTVQFYDHCGSQHGAFSFARILVDVDIKYG
eukprot:CAMPEP_0183717868 /NCGR_PEP_ID=MMETSP0737-20130205/11317_1 /TAXON_ID=385413 /ORGANISM="Thalassiosira miniscula, Strain CCMP1093" /LENGTH=862 /DNA_ID=CAMNT_0025947345 /DNA_START=106 /DNA_END=2694 /DNA_ORIENTATION=-